MSKNNGKEERKKPGFPPMPIDWDKVDRMLEAGCTGKEVASSLGIHEDTLYRAVVREKEVDNFAAYRSTRRAAGDSLLRMKQFEVMMRGDKTMLIWLGKQRLGQADKIEAKADISISDNRPDWELIEVVEQPDVAQPGDRAYDNPENGLPFSNNPENVKHEEEED